MSAVSRKRNIASPGVGQLLLALGSEGQLLFFTAEDMSSQLRLGTGQHATRHPPSLLCPIAARNIAKQLRGEY